MIHALSIHHTCIEDLPRL